MTLYLLAIVAPPAVEMQVHEWKQWMLEVFGCRVALKSPAHITLIPPFKMDVQREIVLQDDLKRYAATRPGYAVQLHNFSSFPPRVIFVNVEKNKPLQHDRQALEAFLLSRAYPVKKEKRSYHPHVTVANRDIKEEDFAAAWSHFEKITYTASFPALAISILRHNGSSWDIIGNAPYAT